MSSLGRAYTAPDRADVVTIALKRLPVAAGLQIYISGDLTLLDRPRIAIVGARRASSEGVHRASQLARDCARAGVVVVSGLAEGIDHAAHTAAIEHGGRTIAVIGTALDTAYPAKHGQLQQRIYREQLLLTPFQWGDRFGRANFPQRNRLMARLAMATVIIEASDTSGSLHQARESVRVGHPVFVPESVANDRALSWPGRFIRDDQPLGRILRSSADVIDFALNISERGVS